MVNILRLDKKEKNLAVVVEGNTLGGKACFVPFPEYSSGEVLVRTTQVGLCSTDREIFNGSLRNYGVGKNSIIPGHEALGVVVDKGKNVNDIELGDIVVPTVRRGCGKCCNCLSGMSDFCSTGEFTERGIVKKDGFMCRYFVEAEGNLIVIPKELEDVSIFIEPLSVVEKAVSEAIAAQKTRLLKGDNKVFERCLIAGCGTVGLMAAYTMYVMGIPFTCVDSCSENSLKARQVRLLGGEYISVLRCAKTGALSDLGLLNRKFDLILEAAGSAALSFALLEKLATNGILLLMGLTGKNSAMTIMGDALCNRMVLNNNMVIGVVNSNRVHFLKALETLKKIAAAKRSDFLKLITHRFMLNGFEQALSISPEDRVKIVLDV